METLVQAHAREHGTDCEVVVVSVTDSDASRYETHTRLFHDVGRAIEYYAEFKAPVTHGDDDHIVHAANPVTARVYHGVTDVGPLSEDRIESFTDFRKWESELRPGTKKFTTYERPLRASEVDRPLIPGETVWERVETGGAR